ncbi:hypothetical protein MNV49_003371 [Pseudohyphozyma bogoriensis]|nr:hypothetical protein MNV49_003371 [Pseudohyphozyma bogoriensis]
MATTTTNSPTDILILGAGWTSTFLLPLLASRNIPHTATTRDGRNGTIAWEWDKDGGKDQYEKLPKAKTVVITFPIRGEGGSKAIVEGYEGMHGKVRWIQLGSSGIWDKGPTLQPEEKKRSFKWTDRHSPFDTTNERANAEEELLAVSDNAFVLNLSGLWGGPRNPLNWVSRIAPTKAALLLKSSVHFIHGLDVSLAILAVHLVLSPPSPNRRYLLTDLRCYDWWDLASSPSAPEETRKWVAELMDQEDVRALPRSAEQMGRALDSREFWRDFEIAPVKGRFEKCEL